MKYDVVIIGGGIVGLAGALKLSQVQPALRVAVLEKEDGVARHQSGNNSGVIHSGIYYKPGSLKALNCAEGRQALIDFCDKHNIAYKLCGKIIVAAKPSELEPLNKLFERGLANGLLGIKKISVDEIKQREPHAAGMAGIFVPQTGIVDFKQVAKAYAELFKQNRGEIFLNQKVKAVVRKGNYSEIHTQNSIYQTKLVVNCAGLYADHIAKFNRKTLDVRIIPFRGEYFKLKDASRHLVKTLIYPVPDPAFPFLGAHFTARINGEVEAGPNAVFALRREGYKKTSFHGRELMHSLLWPGFLKVAARHWKTGAGEVYRSFSKAAFVRSLQKLVPEVTSRDLEPAGAGVRAQACSRDGRLIDDFIILEDSCQIDVLNAPSPAATASLAIGKKIADMALKKI